MSKPEDYPEGPADQDRPMPPEELTAELSEGSTGNDGGPPPPAAPEDAPLEAGLEAGLEALEDEPAEAPRPTPRPAAPPDAQPPEWLVGVRLADGEVLDFDPRDLNLRQGDVVVVDNDRDLNLGRVVYRTQNTQRRSLRRVVRMLGSQDLLLLRNRKREEEARQMCVQRIAERGLPMKLVRVAYLHGGNKAVFFFTADGRVDFRALVRDLAQQLHVRIEMRQIGVRDEARLLTGCGICGQPLCCARYLRRFVPVSIKMAKNQGLALNPQKVSGVCGRLMCCLVYEDAVYKELRQGFPKVGKTIETPRGPGRVLEADVLGGKVRVGLEDGAETFSIEEIRSGVAAPRKEEPRGGRARPAGQSIITRVREQLQEARSGLPGVGPEGEAPTTPDAAGEPDEEPAGAEQARPGGAGDGPRGREEAGGPSEAGERRGRRRRRRRHPDRPAEGGAPQAQAQPRAAEAPRPSPAAAPAGEAPARRGRRRRRRRPGGGASGASNPSPGPAAGGPAAG